jgi:spore coat protein JC
MVGTLVHQLTKNATTTEIENSPMAAYYIDHGKGVYPAAASGTPWSAETIAVKGDPIADLTEDLAADGAIA